MFALLFGLLLSDYMSQQVLSAVFPILKNEWALSDANMATLSSVVALMVGLLALPLALLADRWGRVRALVLMAVLWSVATLLCAVATGFHQMLGARFLVGVGEAAYGSVGMAVVLSVFAPRAHAALSGSFMAGGSFGSVIGVALGGVIAVHLGWRWAFVVMAMIGLALVAVFRVVVSESKLTEHAAQWDPNDVVDHPAPRAALVSVYTPSALCAYLGGGLQMFPAAALIAWLPSYFNRYYHLGTDKAAAAAAILVLLVSVGMVVCGVLTDRIGGADVGRRWTTAVVYCGVALVFLSAGFRLAPGTLSLLLLGCGALFAAGCAGPIAATVARLTHTSVRASAMGSLTLANNLFGLALGPLVVGILADRLGLATALQLAPLAYLAAIAVLLVGKRLDPGNARHKATTKQHCDVIGAWR